jgi:hypothetical protein
MSNKDRPTKDWTELEKWRDQWDHYGKRMWDGIDTGCTCSLYGTSGGSVVRNTFTSNGCPIHDPELNSGKNFT